MHIQKNVVCGPGPSQPTGRPTGFTGAIYPWKVTLVIYLQSCGA